MMLRFFRNIRQKLIEQENMRKYVWYALGEILLVMIGILLALQVNNWNEQNAERAYEIKMLTEVQQSLKSDLADKRNIIVLFDNIERSINEILKMRENSDYPRDSVTTHLNRIAGAGLFFPYTDGAFEAIKTSGLDKISNDSVRNKLVQLYSYNFKALEIYVNEIQRPSMVAKFELFDEIFEPEIASGIKGAPVVSYQMEKFEEVLHTKEFDQLLHHTFSIVNSIGPRLGSLVNRMEEMEKLIELEIRYE